MEPARSIVESLGGVSAVARYLSITPGAVSKWCMPVRRKGTGGLIPSRHIPKLCALAGQLGKFLEPNSFFRGHL